MTAEPKAERWRLAIPVLVTGLITFCCGVLIGWLGIGWFLWPVQWADVAPVALAPAYRTDYLQMVANTYATDNNLDLAARRVTALGAQIDQDYLGALEAAKSAPESVERLKRLREDLEAQNLWPLPSTAVP